MERVGVLFANDFPPIASGIATFFYNIWRHLPPDRTEVLAPKVDGAQGFDRGQGFRILRVRLPLGEGSRAKLLKTVATMLWAIRLAASRRVSKFHCGQVFSSGVAGWVCHRIFRVPYVVYVYGSETVRLGQGTYGRRLMRRVLDACECVLTNSDSTTDEFARFGVRRAKLRKITPGVDTRLFRPGPRDSELVERFGLADRPVLLTVARLDQRKGHDMVMRGLARLGARGGDAVYLIVGRGREEARLRELASELGLEDRVVFAGYVSDEDLPKYYTVCDLFAMPNRVTRGTALEGDIEGFGISFLEANACGKPVIGGRSGGAIEAVEEGVTGLLVDPESEEEIAEAIGTLLEDRSLARRLGENGRRRVEEAFDWRYLARQIEEIL